MNKYLIALILLGQVARAQERPVSLNTNLLTDSTRKNWSELDRIYLITKAIHPGSGLYISPDTLGFDFHISKGITDSNEIVNLRDVIYDAIAVSALQKNKMRQKIAALQMCSDSSNCITWFYDIKNQKHRKLTIEEKLDRIIPPLYWQTGSGRFTDENKKQSLLLYHDIDTSFLYSKSYYLKCFYQNVIMLIGDMVYQSKPKIKRRYRDLIN